MPQSGQYTLYRCGICDNQDWDQKSHFKKHLKTAKHKQQVQIKTLYLQQMTNEQLQAEFDSTDRVAILNQMINQTKTNKNILSKDKKKKTFVRYKRSHRIVYTRSVEENNETKKEEQFKSLFLNQLHKWHNLLRGAAVTGEDAMDDILYCLFLCYLTPKVSTTGNFDIANLEKDCYVDDEPEDVKDWINKLNIEYLSNHTQELVTEQIEESSIYKIGKLLSRHPLTKQLITNPQFIHCKKPVVVQKLLQECNVFADEHNIFSKMDIVGYAWEYFNTKHGGNGGSSKELGQYFTERPVMGMCCQLIERKHIEDLGIDDSSTLGDEFCATFGFPLYAQQFLDKTFNIRIKDHNMYGVEFEDRLSRLGIMNAMFSLSQIDNVKCGDSFITNVEPHLDVSVHNVPFGKSMRSSIIKQNYEHETGLPPFNDVVPIEKNGDAMLATQVVVYKTRKMGVVIVKDGEETSGTSNKKWRQWMCDACVIHKIMKIPTGAFSHTGTKTVCIYFTKHEGQTTQSIQFLELSDDGETITEICNVSRQDMTDNNYSWDPNVYIVDEAMEKMMASSNCEWKKLGDVIPIVIGSTPSTKEIQYWQNGTHPWVSVSELHNTTRPIIDSVKKITDTAVNVCKPKLAKKGTILMSFKLSIGKLGIAGTDLYTNEAIVHMNSGNDILDKWLFYYYLCFPPNGASGSIGGGSLNKDKLKNLDIPIPTLSTQTEVVTKLDDLSQQRQNLSDMREGAERRMKYYFEMMIKKHRGEIVMEKLGDVCEIETGQTIIKKDFVSGVYKVIGGGKKQIGYHSSYNTLPNTICISRKGTAGFVSRYSEKIFATSDAFRLYIKSERKDLVNNLYLYYVLKFLQHAIYNLSNGSGQPGINQHNLKNFSVPFIKQSTQTEVVKYLDALEAEKNSLTMQMQDIDDMMREILLQSYQDTSMVSQDDPACVHSSEDKVATHSFAQDQTVIVDDVQSALTDSLQNMHVSKPCAKASQHEKNAQNDTDTLLEDMLCATADPLPVSANEWQGCPI